MSSSLLNGNQGTVRAAAAVAAAVARYLFRRFARTCRSKERFYGEKGSEELRETLANRRASGESGRVLQQKFRANSRSGFSGKNRPNVNICQGR